MNGSRCLIGISTLGYEEPQLRSQSEKQRASLSDARNVKESDLPELGRGSTVDDSENKTIRLSPKVLTKKAGIGLTIGD